MSLARRINLDRFKKTLQGQIEFAILIEQAEPTQQKKLVQEAMSIDLDFVDLVIRKVVFFEELIYIDEAILAEILSKTSPKILCYALKGAETDFRKHLLKHLGYREMKEVMDEEDKIPKNVTNQFVVGAQKQILKIARELEAKNKFVFEVPDSPFKKAWYQKFGGKI